MMCVLGHPPCVCNAAKPRRNLYVHTAHADDGRLEAVLIGALSMKGE